MFRTALLAPVVLAALSAPAAAQSSLGLNFLELSAGADGNGTTSLRATGDYRVTGAHGLQFDLSGSTPGSDLIAQIDAHLYMQPQPGAKYGLFLSVADLNDRSGMIGVAGIEGLFSLSEGTVASGRLSAGLVQPQGLDFITLEAGLAHAVGANGYLSGTLSLTAVDEASLHATAWSAGISYTHSIASTGFEVSAGLAATGLSGASGVGTDVSARIGVTWRFGSDRGTGRGLAGRSFDTVRPLDPLLVRRIF